jgi:hypothetical protein
LEVAEQIFFDPEMTRQLLAGTVPGLLLGEHFANEKLYGQRAPVLAVINASRPLFDYVAEVAEARKTFPALAQALGLSADTASPKLFVDGLSARVTVTAVRLHLERDEPPGLRFGNQRSSYTISLTGDLPGPVSDISDVELTNAVTVEGISLVPSDTDIGSFRTHSGTTNVSFEVHLRPPPSDSKGLAKVAGYLECGSAENRRRIELFSGKLGQGAKGSAFGTEIEFIGGDGGAKGEKLVLAADFDFEQALSLKVIGEAGQTAELTRQGMIRFGNKRSCTFTAPGMIPRPGKIVAEVVTGSQKVRIPFAVTNLSLLGQPLAAR